MGTPPHGELQWVATQARDAWDAWDEGVALSPREKLQFLSYLQ